MAHSQFRSFARSVPSTPPATPAVAAPEGDVRDVEVTVTASLYPDVHQVRVEGADGFQYAITPRTPGVDAARLHVGQRLLCTVTRRLPRVLQARLVD